MINLGDSVIDLEKAKSHGKVLNRGRKRLLKSNTGVAWGKLLSQYSQVGRHYCCPLFLLGVLDSCMIQSFSKMEFWDVYTIFYLALG